MQRRGAGGAPRPLSVANLSLGRAPAPAATTVEPHDWSNLPETVLVLIADRLKSGQEACALACSSKTLLAAVRASLWPALAPPSPNDEAEAAEESDAASAAPQRGRRLRLLAEPVSGRFHRRVKPGENLQAVIDQVPSDGSILLEEGEAASGPHDDL